MATDPAPDPLIGTILQEKYRVDCLIAKGGMGAVYRGTQLAVGREVAIKVLLLNRDQNATDSDIHVKRFEQEALATSQLGHPNSIRLYDYGKTVDGNPFLVMELLRGPTLKGVLRKDGALPPLRAAKIALQIAKALAEAHSLGIIHRDLKPDNIFLLSYHGESDFVKVVDFGIARMLAGDVENRLTQTGQIVGTPAYMSPEQALDRPVTAASDLYALGILCYKMLTGRVPFVADSDVAVAMKHLHLAPPPLSLESAQPHVASAWSELIMALLAKRPAQRPANATVVVRALEGIGAATSPKERTDFSGTDQANETTTDPSPPAPIPTKTQQISVFLTSVLKRKRPIGWVVGGIFATVLAVTALRGIQSQQPQDAANQLPEPSPDSTNDDDSGLIAEPVPQSDSEHPPDVSSEPDSVVIGFPEDADSTTVAVASTDAESPPLDASQAVPSATDVTTLADDSDTTPTTDIRKREVPKTRSRLRKPGNAKIATGASLSSPPTEPSPKNPRVEFPQRRLDEPTPSDDSKKP